MANNVPSPTFIAHQLRLLAASIETGEFEPLDFEDGMRVHETTVSGSLNRTFDPGLMWIRLFYLRSDFNSNRTLREVGERR